MAEKYDLTYDCINDDFKKTSSFTPKLIQYSTFYKIFCGCLSIRTISAEYLLAMKLCSARTYKHDLSDIVGILKEHQELQKPISFEMVDTAMINLYGNWDKVETTIKEVFIKLLNDENLEDTYYKITAREQDSRIALHKAMEKYSDKINDNNAYLFIDHFDNEQPLL